MVRSDEDIVVFVDGGWVRTNCQGYGRMSVREVRMALWVRWHARRHFLLPFLNDLLKETGPSDSWYLSSS
jgi:hypothetical protein